jgi:hypothetical protein
MLRECRCQLCGSLAIQQVPPGNVWIAEFACATDHLLRGGYSGSSETSDGSRRSTLLCLCRKSLDAS